MKISKLEVGYVYTVTVSSMRKRASVVEHRNVGGSTPIRSTQSSFCPSTPLLAIYRIISSFIKLKKNDTKEKTLLVVAGLIKFSTFLLRQSFEGFVYFQFKFLTTKISSVTEKCDRFKCFTILCEFPRTVEVTELYRARYISSHYF